MRGAGSGVAKEDSGSGWDLGGGETKARRETRPMPFRCQLFGTGIIVNPHEFIDINIRPSPAKTNLDLVENLGPDRDSHVLCSRCGLSTELVEATCIRNEAS